MTLSRIRDLLEGFEGEQTLKQLFWAELGYERVDAPFPVRLLTPADRRYLIDARMFAKHGDCYVIAVEFADQVIEEDRANRFLSVARRLFPDSIFLMSSFAHQNCLCVFPVNRDLGSMDAVGHRACVLVRRSKSNRAAARILVYLKTFDAEGVSLGQLKLRSRWGLAAEKCRDSWPKMAIPFISDPVDQYFRGVGQYELLSFEEERSLVRRIHECGPIESTDESHPAMFRVVDEELMPAFYEARNLLVVHNQRLAVSLAKQGRSHSRELEDRTQDGCLGLLRAAELMDYDRETRFSTYATWWVRQMISRSFWQTGRIIRLPVHLTQEYRESHDIVVPHVRCFSELGFDPTVVIPDESQAAPLETVQDNEISESVRDLLRFLTRREQQIITLRFGLEDGHGRTLEETGKVFNVTRERIRQIEEKALVRLKRQIRRTSLLDDLNIQELLDDE